MMMKIDGNKSCCKINEITKDSVYECCDPKGWKCPYCIQNGQINFCSRPLLQFSHEVFFFSSSHSEKKGYAL